MNFGKLQLGLQLPYGDLLRPLDLCMRLDNEKNSSNRNVNQQISNSNDVIQLQPANPLPQLLQSSSQSNSNINLTEKTGVIQNLIQIRNQTPLTPSPSSSSSFENDEEMGYVGPPPFSIYRRQPPSSVQLNFREPVLPNNRRQSVSSPVTEGSDEDLEMQTSVTSNMSQKESAAANRRSKKPVPDAKKDESYWRRRQKNNMAAKRSREARRQKESELNQKANILELEHDQLKSELDLARQENEALRLRLSKYENIGSLTLK